MTVDAGVDISIDKDRGVLKKIIKDGEGTDTPNSGCLVTVHYTGTLLDGTKFDSSKDRNEPFEFQLGQGSVIRAWDIGVATMKRGEVCVLTCAPQYAYGERGSPPKIPPNATLQFEIEMIRWDLEDLSPSKTKGILRHKVQLGQGFDSPKDGATVTVELEGKLVADDKVFDKRTITFPIGEGSDSNVCDGVETALKTFLEGEKSRLIIKPNYAFGSAGNTELGVPPNAEVEYTVTLTSFEKSKEVAYMNIEEKLAQAKLYKEKGTAYFKQNKNDLAIKMYTHSLTYLQDKDEISSSSRVIQGEVKEMLISANLNLSLAYMKAAPPLPIEAQRHADKALELDPGSVKGRYRRGAALLAAGEATMAAVEFQLILEVEPGNRAAASQLAACRTTQKKQKQQEKQLYANMFDKFAKHDSEAEKLRASREVDVIGDKVGEWGAGEGEWTDRQRLRKPTDFERENPNILMLDRDGQFQNM